MRRAGAATLAIALAVAGTDGAHGQSLTTDKRDYRHDESVRVRYALPPDARSANVTARVDEGPCAVPSWSSAERAPNEGSFRLLSGQGPGGTECHVTIQLVANGRVVATRPIRFLRTIAQAPGLLAGTPSRHPVGTKMVVALPGIAGLDGVHDRALRFKLVRLGRALPGGAVVREAVLVDQPLARGQASVEAAAALFVRIGPHEARIVGAGDTILDRRRIDVVAPEIAGAVRLDPDPLDRPFAPDAAPELVLAAHAATGLAGVVVSLWRIDRGETPVEWKREAFANPASSDAERRRLQRFLRETPVPLAPGTYEIVLSSAGIVLDRRRVQAVGGPAAGPPRPAFAPPLDFGRATIVLAQGERIAGGAAVDVVIRGLPSGVPTAGQKLYLMLVRPEHYTWYCSLEAAHAVAPPGQRYEWLALSDTASGRFVAPVTTGPYELRLYRGTGGPGDVWLRQGELLATRRFDVVAPLHPGLALASDGSRAVTEPVALRGVGPPPPPPLRPLDLVRVASVSEGGSIVETRREARDATGTFATVGRVPASGRYEVRQLGASLHLDTREEHSREVMYVARASFDAESVAFPRLQRTMAPPDLQDWPAENDPVRGVRQWLKPDAECREPTFAKAPALRFAKLVRDASTGAHRYAPVDGVYPGHPYVVEAAFATAPSEESYRVRVGTGDRIEVRRSDDPRVYRSGIVTIVPEGAR